MVCKQTISQLPACLASSPHLWNHRMSSISLLSITNCLAGWLAGWLPVCLSVCKHVCLPACPPHLWNHRTSSISPSWGTGGCRKRQSPSTAATSAGLQCSSSSTNMTHTHVVDVASYTPNILGGLCYGMQATCSWHIAFQAATFAQPALLCLNSQQLQATWRVIFQAT
jgi:hypothetical protein